MAEKKNTLQGFTLLEALVSLSIFAMLCSVLFPVLHNAAQLNRRTEIYFNNHDRDHAAENSLRRLFNVAITPPSHARKLRFNGEAHHLRFISFDQLTNLPIIVELDSRDAGKDGLTLRLFSLGSDNLDSGKLIAEKQLFEEYNIDSFHYFGDPHQTGSKVWQLNWLAFQPPSLLSISLKNKDGNQSSFELRAFGESSYFCDFDTIQRGCLFL